MRSILPVAFLLCFAAAVLMATGFSDQQGCGTSFYEWNGKNLNMIHFEPWPQAGPYQDPY